MIELEFLIDPFTIVQQALGKPLSSAEDNSIFYNEAETRTLNTFIEKAKSLDFASYMFFAGSSDETVLACAYENIDLKQLSQRLGKFISDLIDDASFKPVLEACMKAREKVEVEWLSSYEKTSKEMELLTGLTFSKKIDVLITHPQQRQGKNCNGIILWTARSSFPNYTTIYLWHEIMHSFMKPLNESELSERVAHSVIQLCTDNELRVRLNGGTYPPFEGHAYCKATESALLKEWQVYLNSSNRNIIKFQKDAERIELKREKLEDKRK